MGKFKEGNRIEQISAGYAGIDIGSESLFVAVSDSGVRHFGTFTRDLVELGNYLREQGVHQVAMEATGVYWIPLYDYLDTHGFEVTLFNGAHARNLPGRKTDAADCQWIAMLHSHGLLSPSFIPPAQIRELRSYYRLREDHLEQAASHVLHLQKALTLMNVRLHEVISQIQGVSGLRVVEAILAGKRDPRELSQLCNAQILKHKRDEVIASLEGTWEEHHLFALRQALEGYRFCHRQMEACDKEIERLLQEGTRHLETQTPLGCSKVRHNAPVIDGLHQMLVTLCGGRDATLLPGISPLSFLKLIGEVGTDLSRWKSAKHFTSWLGLAPGNNQSGKRRKRVPRRHTRAGQIFREGALSITRSKHLALGAFYRRIKGRKGPAIALTALARKVAELYYNLMVKGLNYVEQGIQNYEKRYQQQTLKRLQKNAKIWGYELVKRGSGEII